MKRAICDTSTGCLDYYNTDADIKILRFNLFFNEESYIDGSTMTSDMFYDRLNKDQSILPRTSQPSTGFLYEYFMGLKNEGYDEILITTISSKLSGTYNGLLTVKEMLKDEVKIEVFDTKTVCFMEGLFALRAYEMTKDGKSMDEIISYLEELRNKVTIYFEVDNLTFLVKNGRLSGASGFLGTMLKIKPLLQVQEDGRIVAIEKIRTTRKALIRVVEKVKEDIAGRNATLYIVYTGSPELKNFLISLVEENIGLTNLVEIPASPVVGTHVGPEAIGLGIEYKD